MKGNCINPNRQGLQFSRFWVSKAWLLSAIALTVVAVATPLSADTTFKDRNREKVEELRDDLREMITSARDRVFPSLVNIRVTTSRYIAGKEQKGLPTGQAWGLCGVAWPLFRKLEKKAHHRRRKRKPWRFREILQWVHQYKQLARIWRGLPNITG